ncbi:MAG TPA: hypothetical protein VF435_05570 [Pyrinomonadaceae bacterium]
MEHLSQKQIDDYSQNRVSGAKLLATSDHLGECEACRARVEARLDVDALFFAVREEAFDGNAVAHLTSEQAAEYVDKNLTGDELEFVTDHLSSCEQCAFAVDDLRAFRNEIAPSLDRKYGPTPVAPVVRETWWRRLFTVSPVPAFGVAALAILLLSFIGWIVWRTPREEKSEVVVVAPTPSLEPSVAPSVQVEPEPAPVVAQLNDGAVPPAYQELVKKALTSQRIERSSQLQGLTRPPSSLMGANEQREFSVLGPAGVVLMSDRPAFRWSKLEGATGYMVEVYDDQFKRVLASPELTTLSWRATQSLPRGQIYSWQVKAIKDGQEVTVPRPPAPQAKFRVIDQGMMNEILAAKRAYGSSHLTLALLYAKAGLLNEAEQELRLLQRANPQSEIVRKLLRQVR